jgi:heat shock protein HtpX
VLRIGLFLLTNIAVLIVASITLNLLGVGRYMDANGLNLGNLLAFCAVFGFVGAFISLFLSKTMAKMGTRTQIIEQPRNADEQWLMQTVSELAEKAGIGMPQVGIFPSQEANAFATGWNRNDALVAVSLGLLQRFSRDEVKAVMAHEIGHVANGDMVTLSLIQGVVNTFVMFFARIAAYAIDSFLRRGEGEGVGFGFYIATFVFEIIFGIAASIVVAWFSRKREYRADEAGAALASKAAMISALQRLKLDHEAQLQTQMPDSIYAFGINGGFKQHLTSLMASHPPLDDRIRALQNS